MVKRLVAGLVVIVLSLYLIGSVTRAISATADNKDNLIRNSNGNYWEPTWPNIQLAINDLGASGGTVWLPGARVFNITSTIVVKENVMLDMGGASFKLPAGVDVTVVELENRAGIRNGVMDMAGFITTYQSYSSFAAPHSCIFLNASKNIESATIENMDLDSISLGYHDGQAYYNGIREGRGYGIHLYAGDIDIPQKITGVSVRNSYFRQFKNAIFIQNERGLSGSNNARIDGNSFDELSFHANEDSVRISRNTAATNTRCSASGNSFNMFQIQPGGSSYHGGEAITWRHIVAGGYNNAFTSIMCWDSALLRTPGGSCGETGVGCVSVDLTPDSEKTYIRGQCSLTAYLTNEGVNNTVFDTGGSSFAVGSVLEQG
jgi:hypothetical protein